MTAEHPANPVAPAGPVDVLPGPEALDAQLATTAPGPETAVLLASLDPRTLGEYARVEYVAACARLAAWTHAQMADGAAALAEHPALDPPTPAAPGRQVVTCEEQAATTLAWRLQAPAHEMRALVRAGSAYRGPLAATGDAVASGRIDSRRAQVIVGRLHDVPDQVAGQVQDLVLPDPPGRTAAQVRQDVERALLRVDPEHAADRYERARAGRRVSHAQVLPDGMAGLWVVLPALQAVRIDTVLEQCARTARTHGDPRTLDQLRADGLCDLVLQPAAASAGTTSVRADADADADPVVRAPAPVHVFVTMALTTLQGQDDEPAELAGYGPIDAAQARDLAADGIWRRILTDPVSGAVLDVGRTRYRPGAALADHIRHRDRCCVAPGCVVPADRAELDHTVDYHRRPPGSPPGSPPGPGTGTTSADNLGPLCRGHHRLKTCGGFMLRQPRPGVYEWTTPTGHRFRVQPGTDAPTEPLLSVQLTGRT